MYWITGILGLAMAVAPFVFGYTDNPAALWTSLLVGGMVIAFSLIEAAQANREQWEYWTVAILGIVAIAAPFVFGFGNRTGAMWTSVLVGVLIAVFAGSKLTLGQWGKT